MILRLIYIFGFISLSSASKEPQCSKFHYEEQLLEKMIRTEIKVEQMLKEATRKYSDTEKIFEKFSEALKQYKDGLNSDLENYKNNINSGLEYKSAGLKRFADKVNQTAVAFNAYHLLELTYINTDQILVFTKTLFNLGDAYSTESGKFTAPVNGVYVFSAYLCTFVGNYMLYAIVKENEILLLGSQNVGTDIICISATVTAIVQAGEQVWVKCTSGSGNRALYRDGLRRNTFSGVLIHRI